MNVRMIALAAGLALGSGVVASAQDTALRRGGGRAERKAARADARAGRAGQPAANPKQQALAKQVRQAFRGVVRKQLALNDEQVKKLNEVDDRFQLQRNEVNRDERQALLALKGALEDTSGNPDQAKVDEYMSRLVKAQHRRADILESEQKDLSGFLTPVQRAKYFALRDQLNRRIAQLRQQDSTAAGRAGRPPQ